MKVMDYNVCFYELVVYVISLFRRRACEFLFWKNGSSVVIKIKVILAKFSASFFPLKTKNINKNHFILCFSINKMMGKTLPTTQQAWGPCWEPGVLGGENKRG